ncbi:transcription factor NIGT1 isoform X1 [Musa acuminata AAA Group]|uniref:transcription factor NIGT1 isoform X1 n=2 Tax=Musa acuminata AAA Group TaxID=214697 RepID=UPI0031DF5745
MDDRSEKAFWYDELIDALKEERRKIQVFRRELPLCLHLINQTIENYMQLMMMEDTVRTSNETVLKEFISLKPCSGASEENKDPDLVPEKDRVRKPVAVEARKVREDAHPGDKEDDLGSEGGEGKGKGGDGEDKKKSASQGKTRRWWSEDLHKRFLDALQQLGGCHAAKPKHIRELMKVDGLTNDEVKSHLQKYRLHARRRRSTAVENPSAGVPQLVVLGGIWIPPPGYGVAAATHPVVNAPRNGTHPSLPLPSSNSVLEHQDQYNII